MTRYGAIYADPPWPYKGGGPVGNGGRGSQGGACRNIIQVDAKRHYPTMSLADICAMPVESMAADRASLYLWATNSFMEQAHAVCRAWGFLPKTILTWVKVTDTGRPSMKTGWYFRSATEHLLFATRGRVRLAGPCRPTAYLLPRLPHSRKPEEFRRLIEEQSPGPYLELFARTETDGWDYWGNEVRSTVNLQEET